MAQPGYPKQSKPKAPMKPKAPKMSPSKKRRILEAEGRMQQGQTGSVGPPIDVSGAGTKTPPTNEEADAIKRTLREGRGQEYKKGGKVRGAGIARKGTRKCKMR